MLSSYLRIFRKLGAIKTFGFGMIGRIPMAMNPVAVVLLISTTKDSFAYAGFASAAYTLAGALVGPRIGQLSDRHGSGKVLIPTAVVHTISLLVLISEGHGGVAPILISAACAGASFPNIGSYTRTRWSRALTDMKELNSALSIESVLDEIAFVVGPAFAGILYSQFSPNVSLEVGLVFLCIGSLGLARSSGAHDIAENREKRKGGLLHLLHFKPLLLSLIALGGVFGGNTVAILAVAKETGHGGQGGILVAIYSVGSLVAGTLYGMHHWKSSPAYRYFLAMCFMTLATLGPVLVHRYGSLGYFVALSGVAISPTLIAANAFMKLLVPSDRLNEAFNYLGASISIGITLGSAISGPIVNKFGAWSGFTFVTGAAAISTFIALIGLVHKKENR